MPWPATAWVDALRSSGCAGRTSTEGPAPSNGASNGKPASTRRPAGWCRSFHRSRCSSTAATWTKDGLVCPPHAEWATTGLLNTGWVATRARKHWEKAQLEPITFQEARHTAATWLDAAGVPPKVASVLMGHATPERQPGAAPITLARYTHALPEDIDRARELLVAYLARGQRKQISGE